MRMSDLNKTKNINESFKIKRIAKKSSLNEGHRLNEYAVAAVPPVLAGALELIAIGLGYAGRRALIRNVGKHGKVLKAFVNLYNYISGPDIDYDAENKKANKEFIDKLSQTAVNTFSTLQNSKEIDMDNIQDYLDSIKNSETTTLTPAQRNAISAWNTISNFAPDEVDDPPVIDPAPPAEPAIPYPDDEPITKPDVKPDWWPEGIPYNPDAPDGPERKDPEPPKPEPPKPEEPPPQRTEPEEPVIIPLQPRTPRPDKEDPVDPNRKEPEEDPVDPNRKEPEEDPVDPNTDPKTDPKFDPKFNPKFDPKRIKTDPDEEDPDETDPEPAAEPGTITQPLPSTEFIPPVIFDKPDLFTDPETKNDPKRKDDKPGQNRGQSGPRPRQSRPRFNPKGIGLPVPFMKSPLLPIADPLELARVVPNRP